MTPLIDNQPGSPPRGLAGASRITFTKAGKFHSSASSTGLTWPGTSWSRREIAPPVRAGRARAPGPRRAPSARRRARRGRAFAGHPGVLDRGRARDLERRPERTQRDRGRRSLAQKQRSARSSIAATRRTGRARSATTRSRRGQRRDSGAADPRPRRRPDPRPLQEPRQRVRAAHSMHFHGVSYRSVGRRLSPGLLRARCKRQAGAVVTYRLEAGPQSAGIWPYHDHSPSMDDSIDGGLYGALSILGRKQKPPGSRVRRLLRRRSTGSTRSTAARSSATRRCSARSRRRRPVGRARDRGRPPHVPCPRPPLARAAGVPEDTRTIGPGRELRRAWKEDAPGAWFYHCHVESHMMNGMISFYRVAPR